MARARRARAGFRATPSIPLGPLGRIRFHTGKGKLTSISLDAANVASIRLFDAKGGPLGLTSIDTPGIGYINVTPTGLPNVLGALGRTGQQHPQAPTPAPQHPQAPARAPHARVQPWEAAGNPYAAPPVYPPGWAPQPRSK